MTFNPDIGCTIDSDEANCVIDTVTNIMTLTKVIEESVPADTQFEFIIGKAMNPKGAMPAGKWSVHTEDKIGGKYYKVDGNGKITRLRLAGLESS